MAAYAHEVPLTTTLAYLGLLGLTALVMRGAGCTINDIWDKDLDKAVGESMLGHRYTRPVTFSRFALPERTRTRPLACGDITRRQALGFLAGQLAVGLSSFLPLNTYRYVGRGGRAPLSSISLFLSQYPPPYLFPPHRGHIPTHEARHVLATSRPWYVEDHTPHPS